MHHLTASSRDYVPMELTIPRLAAKIPTEADAYKFLEDFRWHGRPVCPHCGSLSDHRYLEPRNKVSRETTRGTQSQRRVWKCRDCRRQFSAIIGTVMHGTHVPIRTWLFVIFEMVSNKNGIAAREVERRYDLHPKTAWFMLHRIREVGVTPSRASSLPMRRGSAASPRTVTATRREKAARARATRRPSSPSSTRTPAPCAPASSPMSRRARSAP